MFAIGIDPAVIELARKGRLIRIVERRSRFDEFGDRAITSLDFPQRS